MVVSFGGVILITLSVSSQTDGDGDEEKEAKKKWIFNDNAAMAGVVGCTCVLTMAILNGVMSVQTRIMQKISVIVTLFYVGACSTLLTAIYLLIEHYVAGRDHVRLFQIRLYPSLLCVVVAGLFNLVGLACKTVAY